MGDLKPVGETSDTVSDWNRNDDAADDRRVSDRVFDSFQVSLENICHPGVALETASWRQG
jgi:hypothetical protein